jgi:PAS domain S-box-containing protein
LARTKKPQGSPPIADARALIQGMIDLHAEDAICVLGVDMRHVAVNAAWKATLGLGDEVVGKTPAEAFGIDDERFNEEFERALAGHEVIRSFKLRDGKHIVQVSLTPWTAPDGQVLGVISRHTLGDLPDTAQLVKQRRMAMAMEMSRITAFEVDFRSGKVTYEPARPNTTPPPMYSYEALLEPLPEQHRQPFREQWERHVAGGDPISMEFQAFENGQQIWRRAMGEAVHDFDSSVAGIVGVMQDITERKMLELELIAEKEAAQAADRSKSEFLANISHEIRTPLNGVLGLASQMRRTQLDAVQHEMIRTIEASAQTLNALLSDVLDLAKIESGRLDLDPQPFDPEDVVRHLHRLFRGAAGAKGLEFHCEIDDSVTGMAIADSTRLNQVLTNLISNAIKFTAAGYIELKVWAEEDDGRQRLWFSVADTGAGIASEALPRLFERFMQADGSISRSYGGTGLGLAISRNLARMMGGDVQVSSVAGLGSTFTLSIDAPRWCEDGLAPVADDRQAFDLPDRRLRVLLVEDHPVNRRVVELILADIADLECAENGVQGLSAFRARPFDVVLMDMQMPVMDGLEATHAMRCHEHFAGAPRTPIIMLSANALSEHVQAGRQAGADFHLAKPITAEDLVDALARALQQPGADQASSNEGSVAQAS